MSLQALMALLGHVTAEMTLRYATLASPALRAAYDEAIGKARPRLPIIVNDRPVLPSKIDWLRGEMLKTRVAHGYCSRHLTAGACPYANICEHCDNYVPAPEFTPALQDQLADVAGPPRRRRTTRLDHRDQPPPAAHRTPPEPPRPHRQQLTARRTRLDPDTMAG